MNNKSVRHNVPCHGERLSAVGVQSLTRFHRIGVKLR